MGLLSSAHTLVDMVTTVMMSYNLKSKIKDIILCKHIYKYRRDIL